MRGPCVLLSRPSLRVAASFAAAIAIGLLVGACGSKSASFFGSVVRLENAAPIPGATVTYTLDGTTSTTKSDASGGFVIPVAKEKVPPTVEIVVTLAGYTEIRRTSKLDPSSPNLGQFALEKVKTPPPGK